MNAIVSRLGGLAVAVVATTAAHAGITFGPLAGGDAEFSALTNGGSLERAVGEGRIGNNAGTGTWEQAIWELGGVGTPVAQAQLAAFTSGTGVPFSISFDGASTVSYTFGPSTLTWSLIDGPFTDIFLRVRATAASSATLSNLFLDMPGAADDTAIGSLATGAGGTAEYIRVSFMGNNLPAFTLSGDSTFAWTGSVPANSQLAYQVKFSNVVPTPAAASLMVAAGLVGLRRRRN